MKLVSPDWRTVFVTFSKRIAAAGKRRSDAGPQQPV
jgi:hypothetical protein